MLRMWTCRVLQGKRGRWEWDCDGEPFLRQDLLAIIMSSCVMVVCPTNRNLVGRLQEWIAPFPIPDNESSRTSWMDNRGEVLVEE